MDNEETADAAADENTESVETPEVADAETPAAEDTPPAGENEAASEPAENIEDSGISSEEIAADTAEDTAPEEKERKLTPEEITAATEALLFAAVEPLKLDTIAKALGKGIRRDVVEAAIATLNEFYSSQKRSFGIVEISGKYSLMSRAEFAPFIQNLYGNKPSKDEVDRKLSPALLDTLAIIAYKQPVTRAEVETVRGVGCGQIIRQLMERGSVKPVGKKMDVVGYPLLYGTTEEFLREFGLRSLDELPMLAEFRRMHIIDDEKETAESPKEETENPQPLFAGVPTADADDTGDNPRPAEDADDDEEFDDDEFDEDEEDFNDDDEADEDEEDFDDDDEADEDDEDFDDDESDNEDNEAPDDDEGVEEDEDSQKEKQ